MLSNFLTTDDGDVVLRSGSNSDSQHDFRVHKFILSLASPVFKDMFTFSQPLDLTSNEPHQLPVIDLPETTEILDIILRFIYPGIEPPNITEPSTLTSSLVAADKYNITSIYPALSETLKAFLPTRSVWVYIIASRFGFLEVAKEAARLSSLQRLSCLDDREDLQYISSTEFFRLFEFVQTREHEGMRKISDLLDPYSLNPPAKCFLHGRKDPENYYLRLLSAVQEAFVADPCIGIKDLFVVLNKIPDPPVGCEPTASWACPLQPKYFRRRLSKVVSRLRNNETKLLDRLFENGSGSG